MDKETIIETEPEDEYIDKLITEEEKIYNENIRLAQEIDNESNKYEKLTKKAMQLLKKIDTCSKKADKLIKKIELAQSSRIGTFILALVFSALFLFTGFNPIMLVSAGLSALAIPLLQKYATNKLEEYKTLKVEIDKIMQLAEMYKQEENYIIEKQQRLQSKMNENFNKFMDLNDELDKIEGIDSLELLSKELDDEIDKLNTEKDTEDYNDENDTTNLID